jgi:hypothetical protein
MPRCRTAYFVLAALLVVADGAAAATPMHQTTGGSPRIVNGLLTHLFPTTGALLGSGNPASASMICSGTMIGCETFLTAGHCVEDDLDPAGYLVFLQHAGFFTVTTVALHPDYTFPPGDVAVLKLGAPVNGIAPTPIDAAGGHALGTAGTIAGFGRSGGVNADYGLKRFGAVEIDSCQFGVSDTTSICWSFDNPVGPPGDDSNTCNGDSGGPLFIDPGSGTVVAGITSGGSKATCLANDGSFDARVSFYQSFIQTEGGADLANTTCGPLPQVGEPDVTVLGASGTLNGTTTATTYSFPVDPGTLRARVAMNAHDAGSDFDLYVKYDSPPTVNDYDCIQNGAGQYGFCEFAFPTAGTWYILINRFSGAGLYQLTATLFGDACADPGNDGLPCDDGNPCTAPDTCQSLACAGTPLTGDLCDDGEVCTTGDTCTAGSCAGAVAPEPVCRAGLRGLLQLRDRLPDIRDVLGFKWLKGAATAAADFGNPLGGGTSYDLCVYDESGDVPTLLQHAHIPAGGFCGTKPCWRASGGGLKGYRYNDRAASADGIRKIVLKPGAQGKAKVIVKGKGEQLALPGLPLAQDSQVHVQLKSSTGTCWGAAYATPPVKNDLEQFKDKVVP